MIVSLDVHAGDYNNRHYSSYLHNLEQTINLITIINFIIYLTGNSNVYGLLFVVKNIIHMYTYLSISRGPI